MAKKIILSAILCICTASAFAYGFFALNDDGVVIYYDITSASQPYTVSVTSKDGNLNEGENTYSGDVVIPSSVSDEANNNYSVTGIGHGAFRNCIDLTSVTIPENVKNIGHSAFQGCGKLTSVTIPDGVTGIADNLFDGCGSLAFVAIPESVKSIGGWAFRGCGSLTSITIPDSVTSIGYSAFQACNSLTSVTIPDGVTGIGEMAFYNCSSLISVAISESVKNIGYKAFQGCGSLISVTIPESVKSIGHSAFQGCGKLTSVTIPDGVTSIADNLFDGCGSLTSVTIPESVKSIGGRAFQKCGSLASILIPGGVTEMGRYAFYGCSSLASVTIPDGVTSIAEDLFDGCSSLTSILIPGGVTEIGSYAFYGCSSLTSVINLNPEPQTINTRVFDNLPDNFKIYVPAEVVGDYKSADGWKNFAIAIEAIVPVSSVSLDKDSVTLFINTSGQLTPSVYPGNATNQKVSWESSDEEIAGVTDDGVVIGRAAGTADIIVTTADGNFTDTCHVTIIPVPVAGVSLDENFLTLFVDKSVQLTPAVSPGNATNQKVNWESSDEEIAGVTDNGVVTGSAAGTADIIVTTADGNFTDTCHVTVIPVPVDSVSLNKDSVTLSVNSDVRLTAIVWPANAANKAVSWESSDTKIADVTDGGVVTVRAAGTADITVTTIDGNKTATCRITVPVPVGSVSLNTDSITLFINSTETLTFEILPNNAANKAVRWESGNTEIAAVTSGGLVTGMAAGTVDVTVTTIDGNKKDTCRVTVLPVAVTGVSLKPSATTLSIGAAIPLRPTVLPDNATNKAVRWESGDPEIASVTANGVVIGRAAGTTDVTVTTIDGNKTATCLVTVFSAHGHTGIPLFRQAQQPAARVYLNGQILHVDSPATEQVNICSAAGTLLYRLNKPVGETTLTVNRFKGILIVRGSSGWSGKLVM